jgi:hypothetical protein
MAQAPDGDEGKWWLTRCTMRRSSSGCRLAFMFATCVDAVGRHAASGERGRRPHSDRHLAP